MATEHPPRSYVPGTRPDWTLMPDHTAQSLRLYIEKGARPSSFLEAVLNNDLLRSIATADQLNAEKLVEIVRFLHEYAPAECWGSAAKVKAWMYRGGLDG
jgi:hypothetical protein